MLRTDDNRDSFSDEAERLLDEIESADLHEEAGAAATQLTDETRLRRLQAMRATEGQDSNGTVAIHVVNDGMAVTATFRPAVGSGAAITADSVIGELLGRGVRRGIDEDAIAQAVFACNTEHREVSHVTIASGRYPESGTAEHIALRQSLFGQLRRTGDPEGSARLDHRCVSRYVIVSSGDLLAKVIPDRKGIPGENVFGEELACETRSVRSPRPGRNVRQERDCFYAEVDGRLAWDRRGFSVSPVLELREPVDYHTGHIDFPGDVILHQEVRDGFTVHAEGSVFAMKTLDASDVSCGGNLVARQGIIGRNRALIKVGGKVVAKYLENCHVEAGGDISVDVGIVNARVQTLGRLVTSRRGIVVGGSLHAVGGVSVGQLGTATGPRTIIHCGTDYQAEERLKWIHDKLMDVADRLRELPDSSARSSGTESRPAELEVRLRAAQARLQDATVALMERLDPDDTATVSISGAVHSGTYIEICHVPHQIDRDRNNVVYRLNKERGAVEATEGGRALR